MGQTAPSKDGVNVCRFPPHKDLGNRQKAVKLLTINLKPQINEGTRYGCSLLKRLAQTQKGKDRGFAT